MKIAVIGTGYVGLVSGACFSHFGFDVTCVDHDADKIASLEAGEIPIYEPGLEDIVLNSRRMGCLTFTTNLALAVADTDAVFIAVGTPTKVGGDYADLTFVFEACRQLANAIKEFTVVVIKSTVPVGTAAKLRDVMDGTNPSGMFEIASNPEFLREGCAVEDFLKPDRIVIGVSSSRAEKTLRQLYQPLVDKGVPLLCTSSESAELIKYASNSYLAMRIGFVNQLTDICEAVGADIADVTRGTGLDKRIGLHYFAPGPCYGGSCFPKDTRALVAIAQDYDAPLSIIAEVIKANDRRRNSLALRVAAALGDEMKDKKVAVLGIAFKAGTDDLRDAPSLVMIPGLQQMGAMVSVFDPAAMDNGRKVFSAVEWCDDAYAAAAGVDAIVILTEWKEFNDINLVQLRNATRSPVLIDMRNIYSPEDAVEAGFTYHSLGRAPSRPSRVAAEVSN